MNKQITERHVQKTITVNLPPTSPENNYSEPPTCPENNYSEPPTSPENNYSEPPTSPENNYSEPPTSPENNYSEPPTSPENNYSEPHPRLIHGPSVRTLTCYHSLMNDADTTIFLALSTGTADRVWSNARLNHGLFSSGQSRLEDVE